MSAEKLAGFQPLLGADASPHEREQAARGVELIVRGKNVISYITRARVPMPKTTGELLERYERYRATYGVAPASGSPRSVA